MTRETLGVWFENDRVGTLWREKPETGADLPPFGFTYSPEWVENGFRLSRNCYLQEEPFEPGETEIVSFFVNLLPEADQLERMATSARLSRGDVFGLLREYGGDCAGAFSILPGEATPSSQTGYQSLDDDELRELIEMRGVVPRKDEDDEARPRLSLAGAQAKSPVFISEDGVISLPRGTSPSSHILKFASANYPGLLVNELFMLRLARNIGLNTVDASLQWLDDEHPYLAVQRYDRFWQGGELLRLHQQDLCQAQDLRDWEKYENNKDPAISPVSFASCLQAVRDITTSPLADSDQLLDWQLFNVLTGNADSHAKNASLVQVSHRDDLWHLAPFYDLVCVRLYADLNHGLALGVGQCYDPFAIREEHIVKFARDINMNARHVKERFVELADVIEGVVEPTIGEVIAEAGPHEELLDSIATIIGELCRNVRSNIRIGQ